MIRKFKANKMIRDNLPEILANEDIKMSTHTMSSDEYLAMIKEKIMEEAYEATDENTEEKIKGEIADTIEALYALCAVHGFLLEDIEKIRLEKAATKGTFKKKIFCETIEMDENNLAISYYLKNSKKYPEII